MDKYLFTDGTVVKEAASKEELNALAEELPDPRLAKVWVFNSHEWIPWSKFLAEKKTSQPLKVSTAARPSVTIKWIKNFLFVIALGAGALMIFNFTSVKWERSGTIHSTAQRPSNVPVMNIDSLISLIELQRGKLLDKSTRTNLRIRNSWPDWISLGLQAEKETSSAGIRFRNISISIDNSTGFNIDNAIVQLSLWKNGETFTNDTIQFNNIQYGQAPFRKLPVLLKADSLSLSFQYIRARSFNFCYSSKTENDPAKFYDRWFCRDVNE